MKAAALREAAFEVRNVVQAIQGELSTARAGELLVSGMLAEQLARELSAGAQPGAVVVGDGSGLGHAEVAVHVIAGDPTLDDDRLVRVADMLRVPVVLVQLWPQPEWTRPYVLSPFVVECRTGEGFPVGEIASRIAESVESRQDLAARIPVLGDAVARRVVREATVRAALIGLAGRLLGASRPSLALEQVRMVSRLMSLRPRSDALDGPPLVAGIAAAGLGSSLVLRELSRAAGRGLPSPLVNALVAAGATWALGRAAGRVAGIAALSA